MGRLSTAELGKCGDPPSLDVRIKINIISTILIENIENAACSTLLPPCLLSRKVSKWLRILATLGFTGYHIEPFHINRLEALHLKVLASWSSWTLKPSAIKRIISMLTGELLHPSIYETSLHDFNSILSVGRELSEMISHSTTNSHLGCWNLFPITDSNV